MKLFKIWIFPFFILLFAWISPPMLEAASKSLSKPLINDITTTPESPPQFRYREIPPYPERFAEIQKKAYPDLKPLVLNVSPEQAFERVKTAAGQMKRWKITFEYEAGKGLEIVATTKWLRFKDDVVIEVKAQNAPGAATSPGTSNAPGTSTASGALG